MYVCNGCTPRRQQINGCPLIDAKPSKVRYPEGIPVGGDRHMFNCCPGAYIGDKQKTVDGDRSAFDIVWPKHWAYDRGIEYVDNNGNWPPKLLAGITLVEAERRAREAIHLENIKKKQSRQAAQSQYPEAKRVIKG